MHKGQTGTLTSLGMGLMIMGIVFAVGLVVLATFTSTVAPNLTTSYNGTLKNTTNTTAKWQTVSTDLTPYEFGRWLNGSLQVTFLGQTNYTDNVTLQFNGAAIGNAYGYNASGNLVLALTTAQLGTTESVTFAAYHNISMNVSSYKISGTYEEWTKTGAADLSTDVVGVVQDVVDWLPLVIIVVMISLILVLIGYGGVGRR